MGSALERAATAVLIGTLVVTSGLVVRRHFGGDLPPPEAIPVHLYRMEEAEWATLLSVRGPVASGTAATLVVFTDYECPYCAELDGWLSPLAAEHADELVIVEIQRPLSLYPAARFEAEVAACLGAVGWPGGSSRLYEGSVHSPEELPADLRARVSGCLERGEGAAVVERDLAIAARFRIARTPMLALNGYWLSSSPEPDELLAFLEDIRAGRAPGDVSHRTETTGMFP